MSEHVERTIEMVQTQIGDLERQLIEKKRMVNSLCSLTGKPPMYADADAILSDAAPIRPDQFYGKTLAGAAREILERRKRAGQGAIAVSDLYDLLVQGGYHFQAKNEANAKRTLYQILGKNPDEFHKIPSGHYGLREWYPNVKAEREQNGANGNGDADKEEDSEEAFDKVKVEGGFEKPPEIESPKPTPTPKASKAK